MDKQCLKMCIPESAQYIEPGNIVKLGRFESDKWLVHFGWYQFGGNKPVCGWYLTSIDNPDKLKPLQLPDLDDIYVIEHC